MWKPHFSNKISTLNRSQRLKNRKIRCHGYQATLHMRNREKIDFIKKAYIHASKINTTYWTIYYSLWNRLGCFPKFFASLQFSICSDCRKWTLPFRASLQENPSAYQCMVLYATRQYTSSHLCRKWAHSYEWVGLFAKNMNRFHKFFTDHFFYLARFLNATCLENGRYD